MSQAKTSTSNDLEKGLHHHHEHQDETLPVPRPDHAAPGAHLANAVVLCVGLDQRFFCIILMKALVVFGHLRRQLLPFACTSLAHEILLLPMQSSV